MRNRLLLLLCAVSVCAAAVAVPVSYTLKRDARVSLAIYDARGRQVRTLLNADPQAAGAHTLTWDGLDRDGAPVPAGTYTWKLLGTQGLQAEYLLSVGTSVGERAWPGQHGGLIGVACDGARVFATAGMSEGSPQSVCLDLDGTYRWASPTLDAWECGLDLAVDGAALYFLGGVEKKPPVLYRLDAATGEVQARTKLEPGTARVDARDGAVVTADGKALTWRDPATGAAQATVAVDRLGDVALLGDGSAVAISGDTVVRVPRGGQLAPFITGLTAPTRVAVSKKDGVLFVVESGDSHRIKRFTSDGKPLATYGRKGGRAEGLYKAEDFLAVSDICADGHGGFFITEADAAPRRLAHFSAAGTLTREWYGGQQFYTCAAPDPGDPNAVWLDSHWGWVMQAQVDWAKRTWMPRACYRWGGDTSPNFLSRYKMSMPHRVIRRDADGDGKAEVYLSSGSHSACLLRVDEAAGRLRPVALLSLLVGDDRWGWGKVPVAELPQTYLEAIAALGEDPKNPGVRSKRRGFAWADADGDGAPQAGEFRPFNSPVEYMGMNLWIDGGMNAYLMRGWDTLNKPLWLKFAPQGFTKTGAPVWDWAKGAEGPVTPYGNCPAVRSDTAGNVYALGMNGAGDGYVAKGTYGAGHAFAWPANQTDSNALMKFDAAGTRLWTVGLHAPRNPNAPGTLHYPVRLAGLVRGCIGVCDKVVQPVAFWTEDGLYAGGLFDRRAADGKPDAVYTWWCSDPNSRSFAAQSPFQYDMLEGGALLTRDNGDVIFLGSGWNNCPAYRITGWEQFERQEGKVAVAAPVAPLVPGTGLTGIAYADDAMKTPLGPLPTAAVWYDEKWPAVIDPAKPVTVRWTGQIRAKFTAPTTLGVYATGACRLWVGGKLLLDRKAGGHAFTEPLAFTAGATLPITLEWRGTGKNPEVHLVWESASQEIRHVPAACLLPDAETAVLPTVAIAATRPLADRVGSPQPARITLTRTGDFSQPLTVRLVVGGTARAGVDYGRLATTATFAKGRSTVGVEIVHLASPQPAVPVTVTLSVAVDAAYRLDGTPASATVTLYDSRRAPIAGVHATASDNDADAMKIVDGSGLDRTAVPPRHDTNPAHQWRAVKPYKDGKPWLLFDLGAVHDLTALHLWSFNLQPGEKSFGPKDVTVFTSATTPDALTRWGTLTLPMASGRPDDAGRELPFRARARYVKVVIDSIHDYPWDTPLVQAGVAEVWFFGVPAGKK
jgi:hypothetical protein